MGSSMGLILDIAALVYYLDLKTIKFRLGRQTTCRYCPRRLNFANRLLLLVARPTVHL